MLKDVARSEGYRTDLDDSFSFDLEDRQIHLPLAARIYDSLLINLYLKPRGLIRDTLYHADLAGAALVSNPVFRDLEEKLKPYFGEMKALRTTPFMMRYIPNLLTIDAIALAFERAGVVLPDKVRAIDVGCGEKWPYAEPLYRLLQVFGRDEKEGPREVVLDGIDLRAKESHIRKFEKRAGDRNMSMSGGDVCSIAGKDQYDFVLTVNMLTSAGHFRNFGLEPVDVSSIMNACDGLLSPTGVQMSIGYHSAGEYEKVIRYVRPERRVAEYDYKVELGNSMLDYAYTPGMDRDDRWRICVARKSGEG